MNQNPKEPVRPGMIPPETAPETPIPSHHGSASGETPGAEPDPMLRRLIERASCRAFADGPIPEDLLQRVLSAGVHAPSGGNLQPYAVIRIEDAAARKRLAELGEQDFIAKAPVSLLFCIDFRRLARWADLEDAPFSAHLAFRHFWIAFQDTIICAQNMVTAADALGLGSCYIGTVLEFFAELRTMCALPDRVFPLVLLCLGRPKAASLPRRKLPAGMVVHRERYADRPDEEIVEAHAAKYPGQRIEPTPERLERLATACRVVGGEALAERALARVRERGWISPAQRIFGLHYEADSMPLGNPEFLALFEAFGFGCFREQFAPGASDDGAAASGSKNAASGTTPDSASGPLPGPGRPVP